jgi:hypothetical protein
VKHSSKLKEEEFRAKSPHPNWKAGSGVLVGFSWSLNDTVLVE